MTLSAVNTADKILVLEGQTDLPAGSRLTAELQNREGKSLLRDDSVVRNGSFFFDFDLDRLSEFSTYKAVVVFDPERAPIGVRLVTGLWGEALQGPGVQERGRNRVFCEETEIMLSESARGRDWEGRDFEEMEVSERSRLTDELERYLEEKSEDKLAKLALARAYIAADPKERAVGSRAHQLLVDASRTTATDRNGQLARKMLADLEQADKKTKVRQAKKLEAAGGGRYRKNFVIEPGRNLGAFRLGSPYRIAVRHFKLDRAADFQNGNSDQTVTLKDFLDVQLTYGIRSRTLVAARTTSPRFRLPEGFGVGSLLQELQKAYGKGAVYTPEFNHAETLPDGTRVSKGIVTTDGLEFEIRREIDASFGIPVDKVSAVTVFGN
jgi:hypothetical protein